MNSSRFLFVTISFIDLPVAVRLHRQTDRQTDRQTELRDNNRGRQTRTQYRERERERERENSPCVTATNAAKITKRCMVSILRTK